MKILKNLLYIYSIYFLLLCLLYFDIISFYIITLIIIIYCYAYYISDIIS